VWTSDSSHSVQASRPGLNILNAKTKKLHIILIAKIIEQ
jgi:hypothetical protein